MHPHEQRNRELGSSGISLFLVDDAEIKDLIGRAGNRSNALVIDRWAVQRPVQHQQVSQYLQHRHGDDRSLLPCERVNKSRLAAGRVSCLQPTRQ
jgi:hypothetical protein